MANQKRLEEEQMTAEKRWNNMFTIIVIWALVSIGLVLIMKYNASMP